MTGFKPKPARYITKALIDILPVHTKPKYCAVIPTVQRNNYRYNATGVHPL
jgi:hypothetical protein